MVRLDGSTKFDLSKLAALRDRTKPNSRTMTRWKKRSARKYRTFLFKRFDRFSRGGGNWRTTRRRRAGKTRFILRRTHTLMRGLSPVFRNLPGQFERFDRTHIQVGYGGPGKHPSGTITVAQLAQIHNSGEGIVPMRQIIVRPNPELIRNMRDDLETSVRG